MEKKYITKIFVFSTIMAIVLTSFFAVISTSRAEDDEDEWGEREEREDRQERYYIERPAVEPIQEPRLEAVPLEIKQELEPVPVAPVILREDVPTISSSPIQTKNTMITSVTETQPSGISSIKDSDQDGIADLLDRHLGEDDFAYSLMDGNDNGIADDLEVLIK
jgi:hypothetical protein